MRTPTILAFLSLAAFSQAAVTVLNGTPDTIYAAVAVVSANEDGSYSAIASGDSKSWTRAAPGSTAFIVKDGITTGAAVQTTFILAGDTLHVS